MRAKIILGIFLAALLGWAALPYYLMAQSSTATITWNTVYQTMDGIGASDAFLGGTLGSNNYNNFFYGTGAGDLNFSLLRTNVPVDNAECNSVSDNCAGLAQGTLGDMQAAIAAGPGDVRVWSSPWSPPAEYKTNGSVDGCPGNGSLSGSSYSNYSTYLLNYVNSLKNLYSINLYALSLQNEPDNCATYDGAVWQPYNAAGLASFDTFGQTLGPGLSGSGVKIMNAEPEGYNDFIAYNGPCINDGSCAQYININAYHAYDLTGIPNSSYGTSSYSQVTWETEVSSGSGYGPAAGCSQGVWCPNITDAMMWAGIIDEAFGEANNTAWNWWWLVGANSDNEGLIESTGGAISIRAYVMGNYGKAFRPGWSRIGATHAPQSNVTVTAYKAASGGNFSIVATNQNGGSVSQQFCMNGFSTVTSVTPWLTDSSTLLVQQGNQAVSSNCFTYTLPGESVITFIGNASSSSAAYTFTPATSPTLNFGQVTVNTSSSSQNITVTSSGTGNLTITSIALQSGVNFSLANTSNCTSGAIAPTNTCTFSVTARPTASAILTDSITITSNGTGGTPSVQVTGATASGGSFSFIQAITSPTGSNTDCQTPGDTTCTLTVSTPINSGDLLMIGSGSGNNVSITGISAGGTFVHCSNCLNYTDGGYVLSSSAVAGGATIVVSFSGAHGGTSVALYEEHPSGTPVVFDTSNHTPDSGASPYTGQALTLQGSNEVELQWIGSYPTVTTAVTGVTNYRFVNCSISNCVGAAFGDVLNTGSVAPPSWTAAGSTTGVVAGMAFYISSGLPTVANPVINPGTSTQTSPVQVSMSDATSGAVIWYSTSTTPVCSSPSTQYSGQFPQSFSGSVTIQAIACEVGYNNSGVVSSTYTSPGTNIIYFNQNAAGLNNGQTCGNAHAYSWINSSSNYGAGAGQYGPGTILTNCGTVTGNGSTPVIALQGPGTSAAPLVLSIPPGTSISPANCGTSQCISVQGYTIIDGGMACGTGSNAQILTACVTNEQSNPTGYPSGIAGIIEQTSNGSGMATSNCVTQAVYLGGGNNTVRNIIVRNVFQTTSSQMSGCGGSDAQAFYDQGNSDSFYNIDIHDVGTGHLAGSGCWSGTIWHHIFIKNYNWGFQDGTTTGCTVSNLLLYNNWYDTSSNWNNTSGALHHDSIFLFNNSAGAGNFNNVDIYNDYFTGDPARGTARIYFGGGQQQNTYIFNEVFNNAGTQGNSNNPLEPTGEVAQTVWIYNNTIIGAGASPGADAACVTVQGTFTYENNVSTECNTLLETQNGTYVGGAPTIRLIDYNTYGVGGLGNQWQNYSGTYYTTLVSWRAYTGGESHSTYTQGGVNLNSSGVPQSGSPALGGGANLYDICNTQPNPGLGALCYAFDGTTRPSSGAWDAGAFQSGGAPPTSSLILTPSPLPSFGNQVVFTAGASQTIVATNNGSVNVSVSGVAMQSTNSAIGTNFSETNNCSSPITPGFTCTIQVTFIPTSATSGLTDSVVVTSTASNSPGLDVVTGNGLSLGGPCTACLIRYVDPNGRMRATYAYYEENAEAWVDRFSNWISRLF